VFVSLYERFCAQPQLAGAFEGGRRFGPVS
jgi:hypothetical protein